MDSSNTASSGWMGPLMPLPLPLRSPMSCPSDFGRAYRPNQRKRRKLARQTGVHPANPHRR